MIRLLTELEKDFILEDLINDKSKFKILEEKMKDYSTMNEFINKYSEEIEELKENITKNNAENNKLLNEMEKELNEMEIILGILKRSNSKSNASQDEVYVLVWDSQEINKKILN